MDSTGINSLPTEGQRAIIVGTENMGSAVDLTVSTPPNTMERVREKLEKLLPNAGNFRKLFLIPLWTYTEPEKLCAFRILQIL